MNEDSIMIISCFVYFFRKRKYKKDSFESCVLKTQSPLVNYLFLNCKFGKYELDINYSGIHQKYITTLCMAKHQVVFGWTKYTVPDLSQVLGSVNTVNGDPTTVDTVKMYS